MGNYKLTIVFNNETFDYEAYVNGELLDYYPTDDNEGVEIHYTKEEILTKILEQIGYDVEFKCSVF